MADQTNALDGMLPIHVLQVGGNTQNVSDLDFAAGFNTTTTTDATTGESTLHVTVGGATVHSASNSPPNGMGDADFTVTETSGDTYVGASAVFTVDRTLKLPASPGVGQRVIWSDEVPSTTNASGALATHNLIVNGNGKQVMSGGTGFEAGNLLAATYTATLAAWGGGGATITLIFNGTFWKVI